MSKVDLVILGLLLEKPRHGYDILQQIEKRDMKHWVGMSTPAVYKGLTRLESKRVLKAHQESGTRHPDRTVYEITPEGRDFFVRMMETALVEPKQPFFNLLTGIGFSHLMGKQDLLALIRARAAKLEPLGEMLDGHYDEIKSRSPVPLCAEYIIEYYKRLVAMERAWLEEFAGRVKKSRQWPQGACKDE
jgi:DNA-binding PadR family transcriptional regulator